ncbi:MAG: hypothetical protein LBD23_12685, partial [Oscillospiraceae bacterium]|nr:hypothetical protein [Oscillospiraceae bacterium]
MLSNDTSIYVSHHQKDDNLVQSALEKIRAAGWTNIKTPKTQIGKETANKSYKEAASSAMSECEMALIFLSSSYAMDETLVLEEFAYIATVIRKPFLPVWLDHLGERMFKDFYHGDRMLSTLEMLTAKHKGTDIAGIVTALGQYEPSDTRYSPSTPQLCEKPCEACKGDEPYMFISYAHDDAKLIYPILKELYESGWD